MTRRALLPALILSLLWTAIPARAQTWQAIDVPVETGDVRCFAESASGVRFLGGVRTFGIVSREPSAGSSRLDDLGDWQRVCAGWSGAGLRDPSPATSETSRSTRLTETACSSAPTAVGPGRPRHRCPASCGDSIAVTSEGTTLVGTSAGTVRSDNAPDPIWQTTTGMEDFVAQAFAFDPARPSRVYAAATSATDLAGRPPKAAASSEATTRADPGPSSIPRAFRCRPPPSPSIRCLPGSCTPSQPPSSTGATTAATRGRLSARRTCRLARSTTW